MAEQDELAAHRNTDIEDEEIAILEELQEITESYGTGVHPQPEPNIGEELCQLSWQNIQ